MATSTIKKSKSPKNYGAAVTIAAETNWKAPSDGIIIVEYGYADTGYCYLTIGLSVQLFTSRSSGDGYARSWVFPIFEGQGVSTEKSGSPGIKFQPYTY